MRYSQELRDHILRRVLPPQSDPVERVAKEEGISEQTIRNWKAKALSDDYVPSEEEEDGNDKWTAQDKFLVVVETSGMSEADLSEYARRKGLYAEQIAEWRDACVNANGGLKMAGRLNNELHEAEKRNRGRIRTLGSGLTLRWHSRSIYGICDSSS